MQFSYTKSSVFVQKKKGSVSFIDTERERQIGLGPDYPFEPLEAGQCVISQSLVAPNVTVGSTIYLDIPLRPLISTMADILNANRLDRIQLICRRAHHRTTCARHGNDTNLPTHFW